MTDPAALLPLLAGIIIEIELSPPWTIRRIISRDQNVQTDLTQWAIGQSALGLADEDSRDIVRARLEVIAQQLDAAVPGPWSNFRTESPNGTKLHLRVRAIAIRHQTGAAPTLLMMAQNTTRTIQARETLTSQRSLMQALFATLTDAALRTDQHGIIREINPAFEQAFGYTAQAIVGQPITQLLDSAGEGPPADPFASSQSDGLPYISTRLEGHARHCDGTILPVEISISVFRADGAPSFLMTIRDLSEAHALAERLTQAIDQASAASRARSELLAHVSHELRTPLNAIVGFSELAGMRIDNAAAGREAGALGGENELELARHVRSIHDAGVRLLTAVDGMLKVAHLEEYRPNHPAILVTVAKMAQRLIDSHQALAFRAGVNLELDLDPAAQDLPLEGDSLQRALGNLLHNAIRLSPPGSTASLSIHRRGDSLLLIVADRGPDFSPALLAKLKLPLVLAENTITERRGEAGLTLGLAIAKTIAELHGGSMSVSSRDDGGNMTTLRLSIAEISPTEKLS